MQLSIIGEQVIGVTAKSDRKEIEKEKKEKRDGKTNSFLYYFQILQIEQRPEPNMGILHFSLQQSLC